jgi:hypothetical protein
MKKEEIKSLTTEIKQGTHAQFVLDSDSNKVRTRCCILADWLFMWNNYRLSMQV